MKVLRAIIVTLGLLAVCWAVSGHLYFDVSWILVLITSVWAATDSKKIELSRYKLGNSWKPIVVFALCNLFWIIVFPWYLWAHYKIIAGEAVLKEEKPNPVGFVRRFFHRLSRIMEPIGAWGLVVLVGLKLILVLVFIEESWRGPRVWENYKHELEAKGQSFDWNAMIPPRVPDSQNIFSAPMMSEWFIQSRGTNRDTWDLSKRMNYTNPTPEVVIAEVTVGTHADSSKAAVSLQLDDFKSHQRAIQLILNIAGPSAFGARAKDILTSQPFNSNQFKPLNIFLEAERKPDVKELIPFFTGNDFNSVPPLFRPAGTNSWHILATFCAASDYLKWSDQFEHDFSLMREAVKRPYARMNGNYNDPATIPLPNYINVRAVSQTLAQRAQCYLLLGQPEKALQELTLLNDLRRLLEGAPTRKPMTLVSAMINVAVVRLYADTIADGFRLHAWKEPQIIALHEQLEQINLAPFLQEAFHSEEVWPSQLLQNVMSRYEIHPGTNAPLWKKIIYRSPANIMRARWMRAYTDLSIVKVAKTEQPLMDIIDPVQKVVSLQRAAEFQRELDALEHSHVWQIYNLFAIIAVPNITKAVQTFAFDQTKANEAQIVCALERYRLAHGNYPETLNELIPQFAAKLPHDIIGGQPLKYRRAPDGQFLLYSIGWNETDDNGQFYPSSYDKGDWSWQ